MSITIGGKTPQSITIGGKSVAALFVNNEQVWPDAPSVNYFYIENLYNSSTGLRIDLNKVGSPSTGSDLSYSLDGVNFTLCTYDSTGYFNIRIFNAGDKVYFRSSTGFSQDQNNYYRFRGNISHSVGGDITTLSDYTNNSLNYIEVPHLFYNDEYLISANLLDCSKITEVGRIDSTHAPRTCSWEGAFYGCYRLQIPPDFPNLTLVKPYGFYETFYGCEELTTPPDMSNVSAAFEWGFAYTFDSCYILTIGPNFNNISQIQLRNVRQRGTFEGTFRDCYQLQEAYAPNVSNWYEDDIVDNISNTYTAYGWLDDVGSPGALFVVDSSVAIPDSVNGCPTTDYDWTVYPV